MSFLCNTTYSFAGRPNIGTVGNTPEGCSQLSEFLNVWVGENEWQRLGPHGANGNASSLVYMNPRVLLHMFDLVRQKKWDQLQPWTDLVNRLRSEGKALIGDKGFTDTAWDWLRGVASGFLTMNVRSRGPYASATAEDVAQLRIWMAQNVPELLEL